MEIKHVMHSFNTAKSLIVLSQGILVIIIEASPKPHSILQILPDNDQKLHYSG